MHGSAFALNSQGGFRKNRAEHDGRNAIQLFSLHSALLIYSLREASKAPLPAFLSPLAQPLYLGSSSVAGPAPDRSWASRMTQGAVQTGEVVTEGLENL